MVSPGELLLQPCSKARLAGLMCKKLVLLPLPLLCPGNRLFPDPSPKSISLCSSLALQTIISFSGL